MSMLEQLSQNTFAKDFLLLLGIIAIAVIAQIVIYKPLSSKNSNNSFDLKPTWRFFVLSVLALVLVHISEF